MGSEGGSENARPAELLQADKEQLDRAAELLQGDEPGLVIVAGAKELVPPALQYLRKQAGVEVPEPVVLQGSIEALDALVGTMPEIPAARVRSLSLGGEAKEALRALNWHREKLLKGAPVVLWLDGVDGLTEMREVAPDAYSFRDMVVLLRGDGGRLPQAPYKESRTILEARRRLARAKTALERANSYGRLSNELRLFRHLAEAETAAKRGLEALPSTKYADEEARSERANLQSLVAMAASCRGSQARELHAVQKGMEEIQSLLSMRAQRERAWLLALMPGPFANQDRLSAVQAFSLAQEIQSGPSLKLHAARTMIWVALDVGDLAKARKVLGEIDLQGISSINLSFLKADQGNVERHAGRMLEAEPILKQAVSLGTKGGFSPSHFALDVSNYWFERGELQVSEDLVRELPPEQDPRDGIPRHHFSAILALEKGNLFGAEEHVLICLRDAAKFGLDRWHFDACQLLAQIATEAHDANQFPADALNKIASELEVAEDVSRSLTNNESLPWYPIRLLGLRADVLIRTDRRTEALDLARRALDLARTTYPDLLPETGRALADHLLRTGSPDDALPLLAEIEPEAVARGMLKELGRIRAARVLALVLRHEPPSALEPAIDALREALESTSAPRIKAETLLALAIRLPPTTALPDPLALASETHTLFVEMPMPAKEARSLELAGDVLAARGKPAEAKRRYRMAHGILERRGLGLRLPLLATKLDQIG